MTKNFTNHGKIIVNGTANFGNKVKARRKKLRKKCDATQQMPKAPAEHQKEMPKDVNRNALCLHANVCIATWRNGVFVTHTPSIRFQRTSRYSKSRGRLLVRDTINFDYLTLKFFGLMPGMQLAFFTEKRSDPKYLFIQNVVKDVDAPAHLHKQGSFTFHYQDDGYKHVCKPETVTLRGYVSTASHGRTPMTLFENVPSLIGKWVRLYQVAEKSPNGKYDLLYAELETAEVVPDDISDKATLDGTRFIDSANRPLTGDRFRLPESLAMLLGK